MAVSEASSDHRQLEVALMVVRDLEEYLRPTSSVQANEYVQRAKLLLEVVRLEVAGAVKCLSTK